VCQLPLYTYVIVRNASITGQFGPTPKARDVADFGSNREREHRSNAHELVEPAGNRIALRAPSRPHRPRQLPPESR
jgi:hypothetical protein